MDQATLDYLAFAETNLLLKFCVRVCVCGYVRVYMSPGIYLCMCIYQYLYICVHVSLHCYLIASHSHHIN